MPAEPERARRAAALTGGLGALLLAAATFSANPVAAEPVAAEPVAVEARVVECGACHGRDGNSTTEGIPSLAGQPETFVVTQLILFREGLRKSPVMEPVADGMPDEMATALAAHYAAQVPVLAARPLDPALAERGREAAARGRCGTCHLPDFSGRAQMPRLAGQREDYLRATLTAYRDGRRGGADTTMNDIMRGVSDADIEALAHLLAHAIPKTR